MRFVRVALTATFAMRPVLAQAQASARQLELGVDASVVHHVQGVIATFVQVPIQQARLGVFLTPRVSLEPAISYSYASTTRSEHA
jgi:hypothetical protein